VTLVSFLVVVGLRWFALVCVGLRWFALVLGIVLFGGFSCVDWYVRHILFAFCVTLVSFLVVVGLRWFALVCVGLRWFALVLGMVLFSLVGHAC
jgi:hypothetical protein